MSDFFKVVVTAALASALISGCGGGLGDNASPTQVTDRAQSLDAKDNASANTFQRPAKGEHVYWQGESGQTLAEPEVQSGSDVQLGEARRKILSATGTVTTEATYNFDSAFTSFAANWWINFWGSGQPTFEAARETRTGFTYAGSGSQRFRLSAVPAGGGAHLVVTHPFKSGVNYRAAVFMRADSPTQVEVQLRRDAGSWNVFSTQTLTLGTSWTRVELNGTYQWTEAGSLRILPITLGTNIYIDEATIARVTADEPPPPTGTVVVNQNFESSFTALAPGWVMNSWGGTPTFEAARETRAGLFYSGTASQRFRLNSVPSGGGAHLVYPYAFKNGSSYTSAVYLRADSPMEVLLQLRRDASPWNAFAEKRVTVGTGWQRFELQGAYQWADTGSIRIAPATLGVNLYIDDLTVQEQGSGGTSTGGLTIPSAGSSVDEVTVVRQSSMDEAYANFAPGWSYNSWGGTSTPQYGAGRETRAGYVFSGAASQRFQVINKFGGEVQLVSSYPFAKGKTYRASVKIRSEVPTSVQVFMRRDAHPWDAFASQTLTSSSTWQTIELEGTYVGDVAGSLRVAINAPSGTVWLDDVTISEVKRDEMTPFSADLIPDTLFGMHVNKLGVHQRWPGMGTRIVRLWNTGTTWADLEPANGAWNFTSGSGYRLDLYVNYILANEPSASILYTLGKTPLWASSTPTVEGLYGLGTSGAPRDMNDWRDYVRTLARRYVGKIRYWELWNEPDYIGHWNGPMSTLVEMARIAREELLAADPNNKLVGPGFSEGEGMRGLEQFLTAGGGNFVDMIGYHWYYSTDPETMAPKMNNVRRLMKTYGVQAKPLWNTEGAFICNPAVTNCSTAFPTLAESRSVHSRAMFVMAAKGIGNFNHHTWEGIDNYSKLVEGDFVTPTAAAAPFAEARTWLRGARVLDAYRFNNTIYMVKLGRGTETTYVVWTTGAPVTVNIPTAWTVSRARTLSATEAALPTSRQLILGLEPVMLRP